LNTQNLTLRHNHIPFRAAIQAFYPAEVRLIYCRGR
jgi:hypothetical protein